MGSGGSLRADKDAAFGAPGQIFSTDGRFLPAERLSASTNPLRGRRRRDEKGRRTAEGCARLSETGRIVGYCARRMTKTPSASGSIVRPSKVSAVAKRM